MKRKFVFTAEKNNAVSRALLKAINTTNNEKADVGMQYIKGVFFECQMEYSALLNGYKGIENEETKTFTVLDEEGMFVCSVQEREVFELKED